MACRRPTRPIATHAGPAPSLPLAPVCRHVASALILGFLHLGVADAAAASTPSTPQSPEPPCVRVLSAVAADSRGTLDDDLGQGAPDAPLMPHPEPVPPAGPGRERLTGDWGGLRSRLEKKGVTVALGTIADFSGVSHQGEATGLGRALFDMNVSLDLERLAGWRGATAHVQYYGKAGHDGTASTGVWQPFSNIDAPDFHRVGELWLQQELGDGRLRVKAGRVDANSEFATLHSTGDFLNASMGYSPTILLFPTYPTPALSVNGFVTLGSHLDVGIGFYDASDLALERLERPESNRFAVAQVGVNWAGKGQALDGRLTLGAWRHTSPIHRLHRPDETHRAVGPFVTFEQTVWREAGRLAGDEESRHVHVFVQAGAADGEIAEIERHVSIGASWCGPFAGRRADRLGLVWSDVALSRWLDDEGAGGRESAAGIFYLWRLAPWLGIEPDLQVITRHWERRGGRRHTVAATWRMVVEF